MSAKRVSAFTVTTKEIYYGERIPESIKVYKPKYFQEEVTFKIKHYTSVVNGIKRIIEDEMENKCLDLEVDDIGQSETHDPYLDKHFVIKRINGIPLNQKVPESFVLTPGKIENNTAITRVVYAGELGDSRYFNPNIRLFNLNPNKSIFIKKIHVSKGYALEDANKYAQVCRTRFTPVVKDYSISSTEAPSELEYNFTFLTNGTIDPVQYLHTACDNMVDRCKIILNDVSEFKEYPYTSGAASITKVGDTFHYTIENEYHTLGQLFTEVCLKIIPDIKFASYKLIHITINTIVILIRHPDHINIFRDTIKNIIDIYSNLKKEFTSPKKFNTLDTSKKYYDTIMKSLK